MGDMGEVFKLRKQADKERKKRNLDNANRDGWTIHTDYHWSMVLNGKRLDYWPSRNKFQYGGKVMCGDVVGFIKNKSNKRL
jgi:hypothetical protein